jgi:hypothetical protein
VNAANVPIDAEKRAAPSNKTGLSRLELAVCVGLSVAVFFLHQGPFWRHRWELDGSIWVSYLVIPPLVAGVLAWGRKLQLREVVLGTIEVTCWKFGLTYLVAHTVWVFSTPPPRPQVVAAPLPDAPALALRSVVPEATGSIEGAVRDEAGRSLAGTVVFIESGLDGYAFDRPTSGAEFSVRSGAVEPPLTVAELHAELRARSADGKLHTLVASQGDTDLFNLPLQSSGAYSAAEVRRGQGISNLRCTVHERAGEYARLVVVAHPFHAVLDGAGRFAWSGVPVERVTIAALHPDGRVARTEPQLVTKGRALSVALSLPAGAR